METSRLIRLPGVLAVTGLTKSTVYRLEAAGAFPARVRLTERCSAWREDEVREWLVSRPRASTTASAAA